MKAFIKNLFLLCALVAAAGMMPVASMTAQTFTTLHSFTSIPSGTNSDGAEPIGTLILSGNMLYGTAIRGGSGAVGTVFAVNTDGTAFTNLHSFAAVTGTNPIGEVINSEGAYPDGLILSGTRLYGAAGGGGSGANGTVFAVNTDGKSFTNLHSFAAFTYQIISGVAYPDHANSDGANPESGVILSGNTLYGTTYFGGASVSGTIFAVNTQGTSFTNLHNLYTVSSEGGDSQAGLILSGNTLFGTAQDGGSSNRGTAFAISANGKGYTNVHTFTGGSDGAFPDAGLILSGNTLYGTAQDGGSGGVGTVFKVNTNGTGFTVLHTFMAGIGSLFPNSVTNSDGAEPDAGLILAGNTLYGTTMSGGSSGNGTVFAVNTNGTGFTSLHCFTATNSSGINDDGASPNAGLVLSGNLLYGTASFGGSSGNGTVFSIFILPPLSITRSDENVILTWPTNSIGFTLQSTTNPVSPAFWSTVSPPPVPINGQNTVTNAISGTQMFYRLSQ